MRQAAATELFVICSADELPPGSRRIVEVAGRWIGIFNVAGELFAIRNRCPHQGAPLGLGELTDLSVPCFDGDEPPQRRLDRFGEIIRCPWHGWEFDLRSGEAIIRGGWKVGTYRAFVADAETAERVVGPQPTPPGPVPPAVETYQVGIDGGMVVVELTP